MKNNRAIEHNATRIHALFSEMSKHGLMSSWITSPANIYYITGWMCNPHERFLGLYVDAIRLEAILFVPALDYESAVYENSTISRVIAISDEREPFAVIANVLGNENSGIIGIEKRHVNVERFERFIIIHSKSTFVDISDILINLRMVKDASEVRLLENAVHIAEKALTASLGYIRAGITELELATEITYQLREAGSEKVSAPMVLAGANSALPHGHTGHYLLKENDFVMIDFGAYVQGYGSDLTRTFLLGEGTKEQERIYEIVLEANNRAIHSLTLGYPYSLVDDRARQYIEEQGFGAYFTHRTGHGLGIEMHEEPSIHGACEIRIAAGHLFTVEPGIYVPELGGVRIEDNVYIESTGQVRVLSTLSKELQRL